MNTTFFICILQFQSFIANVQYRFLLPYRYLLNNKYDFDKEGIERERK